MILRNVRIFSGSRGFIPGTVRIEGERFEKVEYGGASGEAAGLCSDPCMPGGADPEESALILPGLIDIHTHGNSGRDFSDGDEEGLRQMGRYLAAHGITSFLPTSMTLPYETLEAAFLTARRCQMDREPDSARIMGIHMEGPFFSEKKKGAQNALYLKLPDAEAVAALNERCGGLLRIVDVAPELPGAEAFTRAVTHSSAGARPPVVSIAHTDASYEETKAVIRSGAAHVTHLFNAMPGLNHRKPGVIGAAAEEEGVTVELICDGQHIHPAVIRLAFRLFPDRVCLISDSLRCCGMPDGSYELGGQQVTLRDQVARLSDGTIAGAASNLFEDMKNAIRFGIPVREAVMAATLIPARAIGRDHEIGSIEEGKYADFLVCGRNLDIREAYIGGKKIGG